MGKTRATGPDAPASQALRKTVWDLAVQARRTVPTDLTTAQAEALIEELRPNEKPRRKPRRIRGRGALGIV